MSPSDIDAKMPVKVDDPRALRESISRALRRNARKARAPAAIISGGAGFQARKGARAFRMGLIASFVVVVLLPFLAASTYWGLMASDQYVTETKFSLRSAESSPLDMLGGMMGAPASQSAQDAQIILNYIKSRTMVEALNQALDLRRIYSRPDVDYFSRFKKGDAIEDLVKYVKKRMDVSIEPLSGIIHLEIRAFTPEDSLALTKKAIDFSESLVNDLSTRARKDSFRLAQSELTRAEDRLRTATEQMREVRDKQGVLDATAAAEAITKVITTLRIELSHAEESLATLASGTSNPDAPQVRILNARIASLKNQIEDYTRQIAGGGKDSGAESMADRLGALSRQQVELDLARQQYVLASANFESARLGLETQNAYLVSFLRPALAEKSTYPRRWWEWAIVVVPALVIWALLSGVAFVVRDFMAK
jgi:capsular polysaccharide transport system permease protein